MREHSRLDLRILYMRRANLHIFTISDEQDLVQCHRVSSIDRQFLDQELVARLRSILTSTNFENRVHNYSSHYHDNRGRAQWPGHDG